MNTIMHGGYGFIEGWFYGKACRIGKKGYMVAGFAIAWILHGLYDFGLSPIIETVGEYYALLSVSIAIFALVLAICMVVFFARKKKQKYLEPLVTVQKSEA